MPVSALRVTVSGNAVSVSAFCVTVFGNAVPVSAFRVSVSGNAVPVRAFCVTVSGNPLLVSAFVVTVSGNAVPVSWRCSVCTRCACQHLSAKLFSNAAGVSSFPATVSGNVVPASALRVTVSCNPVTHSLTHSLNPVNVWKRYACQGLKGHYLVSAFGHCASRCLIMLCVSAHFASRCLKTQCLSPYLAPPVSAFGVTVFGNDQV